jgi:sodium-dependent phosphate cotransporter
MTKASERRDRVDTKPRQVVLSRAQIWLRLVEVFFLLFVFLVGIRGLGSGFKGLGGDLLQTFFAATENPFVGLTVGILATSIVQSSSVTTSMVVALVAAPENPLPITNAIPMIMGANIGTTVTNTVVSLGHIARPEEFKRAFAAATCHDFFNFLTVAILLPLEIFTGILSKLSLGIASMVGTGGGGKLPNPIKMGTKAVVEPLGDLIGSVAGNPRVAAVILILVSATLIFVTLFMIVKVLKSIAASKVQTFLTNALDANAYVGIIVGILITVMVQSSSITTSLMVPLAGAGIVTLAQVFPITLGSNIGTTITAILASMAVPSETAHLAVQIAAAHLLCNVLGLLMVYPIPTTRRWTLSGAAKMADLATRSRKVAVISVLAVFYGLPAALIAISKMF